MLGLHHPGHSPLHRSPAGVKLLTLLAVSTVVFFLEDLRILAGGLLLAGSLYAVAGIPWRTAVRQSTAVVPVTLLFMAAQWVLVSWHAAAAIGLRIAVVVLLANLVTLTTPTSDMITAVERALGPLRRFGLRPERVGLAIALTIRFVPVIAEQARLVRQAQRARGVRFSLAFLTPLLVRTLRMADGLGEALDARGWESSAQ
ncbi:energy-coupling factor transporter transmembrane protein EcfT [Pseudonocardiaceae bacterium YIM PH 21723]|nr:energy-coupling factor transporter transmembrane protein EcfT [Pseudonocardiaceae bacterium YIM PH 21723]